MEIHTIGIDLGKIVFHLIGRTSRRLVLAAAVATGFWTGISGQTSSSANSPQVTRIDVSDVGIFSTDMQSQSGPNQEGLHLDKVYPRLVTATQQIPLKLGVEFGFRYSVVGTPNGAPVELRYVTIFPPAGLHNPAVDSPILRNEGTLSRQIGGTYYNGTLIRNDWAMVPGDWTLEIWSGDQKLASETFTVH